MTIRTRLALGLFAIAGILLLPLVLTIGSLNRLHRTVAAVRDREFAASLLLGRMRSGVEDLRRAEMALLFLKDTDTPGAVSAEIDTLGAMADSLRLFALDSASARVREALAHVTRYAPLEHQAALSGNDVTADTLSERYVIPAIQRVDSVLASAERALRVRTSERVRGAADATVAAQRAAAVAAAVAGILALVIAIALWRAIAQPVRDLEAGMAAVADGKFEHRLPVSPDRHDEFGRLAQSFQTMAAQLAQLDRLKAEFVSVASHELKTPINVILGYVQLFNDGVYGQISPKQREILATLESQGRSLARLVQQLLDVSRFEAGGGRVDLRPVKLVPFLGELESAFRVLAIQRRVDFRIDRSGPLPTEVVWDPDRINEVLGNLLSNAFKFTDEGGMVELTVDALDDDVHISVRDTGAGIPQEQLPHIFEKFFQADNQDAAAQAGTGLGLAIAQQIVVAHHGHIAVDSTVGVGTTFMISLPVRADARRPARQRPVPVGVPA